MDFRALEYRTFSEIIQVPALGPVEMNLTWIDQANHSIRIRGMWGFISPDIAV